MIERVTIKNFDEVLPLIEAYQKFYKVTDINIEKNKEFFSQFLNDDNQGYLYLFRAEEEAVGFTTIYSGYSSTRAEKVAILNDLYISPAHRRKGYAKELITNAIKAAKERGFSRLQWLTTKSNEEAQNLYDSLGANKSEWYFYTKET